MRSFGSVLTLAGAAILLIAGSGKAATPPPTLTAYMSMGVESAVKDLIPEFEKATGQRIEATWATATNLDKRLRAGDAADLLISTRGGIEALIREDKVVAGSAVDIASSGVGIAVRKGDLAPDVSTPDALRRTLLAARSISYSDPAAGGSSGVHFAKVLERLGIADQMKAKTRFPPPNGLAASLLVSGESDLAIQQTQELSSVAGVEVIGPLPGDLQLITTFTAGIPTVSRQAAAANNFVRFLESPRAQALMKQKGLNPSGER